MKLGVILCDLSTIDLQHNLKFRTSETFDSNLRMLIFVKKLQKFV